MTEREIRGQKGEAAMGCGRDHKKQMESRRRKGKGRGRERRQVEEKKTGGGL